METSQEVPFRAYPKGKNPKINPLGWKLAHIYSINKKDYNFDYKHKADNIFHLGSQSDWKRKHNGNYIVRELSSEINDEELMVMKAHFLRLVHPINYFLVPSRKFQTDKFTNNIGELKQMTDFMSNIQQLKYGSLYDEYKNDICAISRPTNDLSELGSTNINLKMGYDLKINANKINNKTKKNSLSRAVNSLKGNDKSTNRIFKYKESVLPIELIPNDIIDFKKLLLEQKWALITVYYNDGNQEVKEWKASKMTIKSDVIRNFRSKPEFRQGNWQNLKITRIVVKVDI